MDIFSTKPPRCRLLELPAEIRELIFTFAVVPERPIVTFRLDRFQKESYEEASQPPITRVSRQLRREALPLFYGCNEFIVHTEDDKSEDAQRWFRHSQPHLPKLCHLMFWVRYVARLDNTLPSSGAIGVTLWHDARAGSWEAGDQWRWITVLRKPANVEQDGESLVEILKQSVDGQSRSAMTAEHYVALMKNLRALYLKTKTS
ncbi:hypothetical protein Q7P37_003440 [Cladosporium fusiforme]